MFHRLLRLSDLRDGLRLPLRIGRRELLLIHEQGRTWIVQRRCPHANTPLERATVRDGLLRCPGHGLEFSLDNGRCRQQADLCLQRHEPIYDEDWLGVILE